jgi:Fic family protein
MNKVSKFKDFNLRLPRPSWDSPLAQLVFDLEALRTKKLYSKGVPAYIFFQLKEIFHTLESIGSARIEGNRTTLAEYVEKKIDGTTRIDESAKEIDNIQNALEFIHENITSESKLTENIFSELHKIVTNELTPPPDGEGSARPGELRNINPRITGSDIVLADFTQVPDYVVELIEFINRDTSSNNDLLVTAVAHHRFAWTHPYDNGNGRLVRLLTYLMLVKQGFKVKQGSILNPTAIFCIDREEYYSKLAAADTGTDAGIEEWCIYVLSGLKREIEKIDQLLDPDYLVSKILIPVFKLSLENKLVTPDEYKILSHVVNTSNMQIKAGDLEEILGVKSGLQRTRIIVKLRDKKMLKPITRDGRVYTVAFANSYLLRGIIEILTKEGFVANLDNHK